jgi:hypothetical protein
MQTAMSTETKTAEALPDGTLPPREAVHENSRR